MKRQRLSGNAAFRSRVTVLLRRAGRIGACALLAVALSGCGVFCSAAGGSGGAVAGGCGTGMRF